MIPGMQSTGVPRVVAVVLACLLQVGQASAQGGSLVGEAFVAAQEGMSSAAAGALRQIGLRTAAGDGPLAERVRQRQDVEDRLRAAEIAMARPDADRIALSGETAGLEATLARLDAALAQDFPEYASLTRPQPLDLAEVQRLLGPDEALILIFVGETYAFVWAVSPTHVGWHRLNAGQQTLAFAVDDLRATLDPKAPSRGAAALDDAAPVARGPSFDRALAAQIYDVFLRPLVPVFGQAGHIYVVPDGPLTGVPFGLLVTAPFDGADDDPAALRATPWMIKSHALTTLPSVESLRTVKTLPPPRKDRPILAALGDPVFAGASDVVSLTRGAGLVREGLADVDRLKDLSPLPKTRTELLSIARILDAPPGSLRLGAEATEAAVKAGALGRAQVVAFATHGLLSGEIAGLDEPALVLTPPQVATREDDGLLTASEIAGLSLDADWVILSACNTAGGAEPGAEGLSGLARAFLFAGARSILVSHWPVRDDAAARLTTDALGAMADGSARTRAEALRLAMLKLMQDPRDPTLAHPSAWAPFVLVGEGG